MAFINKKNAKTYTPQKGDTLDSIAKKETKNGNPISWQDIAQYNWGTNDEDEVESLMRDEMGARYRNSDNRYEFGDADIPASELKVPQKFTQSSLSLKKSYQIRVRKKESPKQFLGCSILPSATFGFNSSFIRPSVIDELSEIKEISDHHPDSRIMIFGHTDAVGDDIYNKKLSERRAWSAYAFIVNDADAWETLYNHKDENWGTTVIQEILMDLGHDPGAIDGKLGPNTKSAMRSFLGLDDDDPVSNDSTFRHQLFSTYMSEKNDIDISKDRFLDPGYMGCGEINLIDKDNNKSEKNRRVTFYFFHQDRLPVLPCKFADTTPCKKQSVSLESRNSEGFICSYYDSLSKKCFNEDKDTFMVYLLDTNRELMKDCEWQVLISGSVVCEGKAKDGLAIVHLKEIPDQVTLRWGGINPSEEGSADFYYECEYYTNAGNDDDELFYEQALSNLGYESFEDFLREFSLCGETKSDEGKQLLKDWHSTGLITIPDDEDEEEHNDFIDYYDEDYDDYMMEFDDDDR